MTPPRGPAHLPQVVGQFVSSIASWLGEHARWVIEAAAGNPVSTAAVAAGVVTGAAALKFSVLIVLRRVRHRRLLVGARLVTVLAPPRVHPKGAAALWGNLAGLARPRWRRLLCGQPHLCFEYVITEHGSVIRIWVPGPVPPGLVEQAVVAAWPGATTRTTFAAPDLNTEYDADDDIDDIDAEDGTGRDSAQSGWRVVTAGGVLRLGRAGGLPIDEDAPGDPVAALLAAPGDLHTPPTRTPPTDRSDRDPAAGRATSDMDAAGDVDAADNTAAAGRGRRPADRVIVQVLARPVAALQAAHPAAGSVSGGLVGAVGAVAVWAGREILTLITPGPLSATDPAGRGPRRAATDVGEDRRTRLQHSSADRAAVAKARGTTFETLIRYAATTHITDPRTPRGDLVGADRRGRETARQREARARARGRAHAVAAVFASFTDHNFYRRHHLWCPDQAIAGRRLDRGDLLSVAELAAIAALPTTEHTPGLLRARARAVAPPPGIAGAGPDVKPLGDTTTSTPDTALPDDALPDHAVFGDAGLDTPAAAGSARTGRRGRPVGIRVADARHHLHVIGATGSGKSTLLVRQILADIHAGRGVAVIDPKGDLVTDIVARLPAPARHRALIIDPDQPGPPPCLNPLATPHTHGVDGVTSDASGDLAVENLVSIFARVFGAFWGPRTDDLMRAACLTLHAQPTPRSLADLPALLTDADVRARHLRAVHDPLLTGFWAWYGQLPDPTQAHITAPLMNKVRALLLRPFTRAVLTGQSPAPRPSRASVPSTLPAPSAVPVANSAPNTAAHTPAHAAGNTVDMTAVLDGGILLARLPKGSLGDEGTRLVGSIVVAQVWAAATARTAIPQQQRRDAALVIDECHNFLNLPYGIPEILAEARGLRLSLTLAHQNLAQLPRDLREGISSNARNKIFFTVGPDDAHDLARHTLPQLGEHDLAHLDAFHAAARLVNHGADTPAFTLHTRPLPAPPQRSRPHLNRPRPRPASCSS